MVVAIDVVRGSSAEVPKPRMNLATVCLQLAVVILTQEAVKSIALPFAEASSIASTMETLQQEAKRVDEGSRRQQHALSRLNSIV